MFVGETGIGRVVRRTLEIMAEIGSDDPAAVRRAGGVDLPTLQRYLNFWFSSSLDLFGADISSNAATSFAAGLKGRPDESRFADHVEAGSVTRIPLPDGQGGVKQEEVATRSAMNYITRSAYIRDCEIGLKRWNKTIQKAGVEFELTLPSERFNRMIGAWANLPVAPDGTVIDAALFARKRGEWLPSDGDREHVRSLMVPVTDPGKMASWIAPPDRGINNLPVDYEYVHLAH